MRCLIFVLYNILYTPYAFNSEDVIIMRYNVYIYVLL